MKKLIVGSLLLAACLAGHSCGKDGSSTGPSVVPSPSPVASPTPAPPTIDTQLSVDVLDEASRQLVFTVDHGQGFILKASVIAFDRSTGAKADPPRVRDYAWSDFSDPFVACGIFGDLTSDHPHGKCMGDGYFIFRVAANGYDGAQVAQSRLYSLPVGAAALSTDNQFRALSDDEASAVLRKWGAK